MVNDILDLFLFITIGVFILILVNCMPNSYIVYYIDKSIDKYGYDVVKISISLLASLVLVISLLILLWFL